MAEKKIKLVIGLGNPDPKYEETYHNAGKTFVSWLVKELGCGFQTESLFEYAKCDNYIWVVPRTFMNESGRALLEVIKKFGAKKDEILVVHDDSDIALGQYKISFNRSSAGHKGVDSVIHALRGKDFWRLRIGIRPETLLEKLHITRRRKASSLVLSKTKERDKKIFQRVFSELKTKLMEKENP
jgi:PTH1 family peptidyl-tRNA hydrolase